VERDADARLLAVVDSSFLINFLAVDRMDILGRLRQFRFHVVNHVRAEVRYDDQRVGNVEANISNTILEVFGPNSPQYRSSGRPLRDQSASSPPSFSRTPLKPAHFGS